MSKSNKYNILLALPNEGAYLCIEKLLHEQSELSIRLQRAKNLYALPSEIVEGAIDLLIVSPLIISDPFVAQVRKEVGFPHLKLIAYCTSLLEEEYSDNFDGKLLVTDSSSEMVSQIESVLALEPEEEEEQLTPREKDVVIAVVKGLTNKEIADEFCLSPHTIITHRRNIARKLNIHSPSGLTIYAIMNKLVSLDDIKG